MMKIIRLEDGSGEIKGLIKKRREGDLSSCRREVSEIIKGVKKDGDRALLEYTERFDGVELDPAGLSVKENEFEEAFGSLEEELIKSLELAGERIRNFHQAQVQHSWNQFGEGGVMMGQICRPLERVGIYIPGGSAAYPSSVLMTAIPARVAGVDEIIMVTPPGDKGRINPAALAAAKIAGVDRVYKVGGAQAVAALASGTETIPVVDKIVGPGNIYVALAKQMVYGQVDIDMIAGPSEILIIADEGADPSFLAADLLSQAEHDPMAAAILVSNSEEIISAVQDEIDSQIKSLIRKEIIRESLENYGALILVDSLESGIEIANQIAPEHLELALREPFNWLSEIKNAGAIFLGDYAPEALGDYLAGPNHVLPTNGTARFFSPLSVRDFLKYSSFLYYSREELARVKDNVYILAEKEGLQGHANAVRARFKKEGDLK